jgi:hypothetical protein
MLFRTEQADVVWNTCNLVLALEEAQKDAHYGTVAVYSLGEALLSAAERINKMTGGMWPCVASYFQSCVTVRDQMKGDC